MIPDPKIALLIFLAIAAIAFLIGYLIKSGFWKSNFKGGYQLKTQTEDVLKQLYHVQYSGKKATLNAMAGALKINDKKLVALIEYMSALELIKVSGEIISLTDEGKDYALKIIRIHRLWEKYLSEKTGIHKSEWHKRAEKMEHALSPEETEKLYQQLGNPRYDPHGDPIPTKTGEIASLSGTPLCNLEENSQAKIIHIEDEPAVIYKQIIDKKLHIGQHIKMLELDEHKVTFTSEGETYSLSNIVASNIGVKIPDTEEIFEDQRVRLSALEVGEKAKVVGISRECRGASRRRLLDFGFINGATIETSMNSPMKEPKAYMIKNTLIALRNDQADLILIEKIA